MAKQTTQRVVILCAPITRGAGDKQQTFDKITLRKPSAGELRGVRLLELITMDVAAVTTVVPRISEPALTEAELATMDPADFTDIAVEVAGFLSKNAPSRNG